MLHKVSAALLAGVLALATIAPTDADARDRRGRDYHSERNHRGDHYRRHHRNNNDELAVGALGLVLGLAIGAAVADNNDGPRRADCSNNYQYCPPPAYQQQQGYYNQSYDQGGYSQGNYDQQAYDEGYSAYEDDYGDRALEGGYAQAAPSRNSNACLRQVEQWDPVAGRYAIVNVRQPCD
jgi:hypothetical protein